jgi:hypothetical protein
MRFTGLSIALALGMAAAAACTLELDRAIACGDGYVDELAGEACDPLVESSYVNACLEHPTKHEGKGGCNPRTCQLDFSECALCGDGRKDPGEECDGEDFGGERCPVDQDGLRCTSDCKIDDSACPTCGNGILDEGEECDFMDVGGLVTGRQCAGTDDLDPLEPPNPQVPYASGVTTRCTESCRFDRRACTYCGNGVLDDARLVDLDLEFMSEPEACDGEVFDLEGLQAAFGDMCFEEELDMRPNVGCDESCRGYVQRPEAPSCCVRKNMPCNHPLTEFYGCCYAYENPDEDPCEERFHSMGIQYVCK